MIAQVIIDRSAFQLDKPFEYIIPDDLKVEIGHRVIVPFANEVVVGFCINIVEKSEYPIEKLKSIIRIADEYVSIPKDLMDLMYFMKEKYFLKYIDILRLFIPSDLRTGKVKELLRYYLELNKDIDMAEVMKLTSRSAKQQDIVYTLESGVKSLSEISDRFGAAAVNSLIKKGIVIKEHKQVFRVPLKNLEIKKSNFELTQDQKNALSIIENSNKDVIMLRGVTGSGKTLVYIEAIKKALLEDKGVIMLVPEIALTPQAVSIFRGEFGDKIAVIHSNLSAGEKFDEWKKILYGEARIVIGARSAIFTPVYNLGLVIIDEEHDQSYSADSNPRYRAHEVAEFRVKNSHCKLILGSATPSIITYKKVIDNEYDLAKMTNRISKQGMPQVELVNMKDEIYRGNNSIFSRTLLNELENIINKNEQAMILINRLGFSSFIRCSKCGYIPKCKHCDVSLSYHKKENVLMCHYCGAKYAMLKKCPECGGTFNFGKIGTEKVVEELIKAFPDVKILKLDSTDKSKNGHLNILKKFANNEAQILVGTQMIAKGHDFPNVTLVGVIDADSGLYQQDYRSNERTFQLITQVAGRAGRDKKAGKVIVQTYNPSHYVYQFAINHDYINFFEHELNVREITGFPPFASIIRILLTSKDEEKVKTLAREVYVDMSKLKDECKEITSIAGMVSPISMLDNQIRYQIVIRLKNENEFETLKKIYGIIDLKKEKGVSIFVELDPQSLM